MCFTRLGAGLCSHADVGGGKRVYGGCGRGGTGGEDAREEGGCGIGGRVEYGWAEDGDGRDPGAESAVGEAGGRQKEEFEVCAQGGESAGEGVLDGWVGVERGCWVLGVECWMRGLLLLLPRLEIPWWVWL